MHAIRVHSHGGPDHLIYEEVADPVPGPNEVVVRVRAAALNRRDIWIRQGRDDIRIALPCILGMDVSGEIDQLGSAVVGRHVGERVVLAPGCSCMRCEPCLSGDEHLCRQYRVIGSGIDGGYAERVAVPATNAFPIPDTLAFSDAAAIPVVYQTAWHLVVRLARVQPGERLLIHAVGGGAGLAALQIAKVLGARTIVTAGADWKLERAREYGADDAINYSTHDFVAETLRLTHGHGVHVVVEQLGGRTLERSLEVLARGGRLLTFGATTGSRVQVDLLSLHARRAHIIASSMGAKADLQAVLRLVAQGQLRPVVGAVLPLHQAAEAHRLMEDRGHFGKIVLVP
ncbi:MAG: zinc-binding dehydrogenase [Armatimonadota bacterium]